MAQPAGFLRWPAVPNHCPGASLQAAAEVSLRPIGQEPGDVDVLQRGICLLQHLGAPGAMVALMSALAAVCAASAAGLSSEAAAVVVSACAVICKRAASVASVPCTLAWACTLRACSALPGSVVCRWPCKEACSCMGQRPAGAAVPHSCHRHSAGCARPAGVPCRCSGTGHPVHGFLSVEGLPR